MDSGKGRWKEREKDRIDTPVTLTAGSEVKDLDGVVALSDSDHSFISNFRSRSLHTATCQRQRTSEQNKRTEEDHNVSADH